MRPCLIAVSLSLMLLAACLTASPSPPDPLIAEPTTSIAIDQSVTATGEGQNSVPTLVEHDPIALSNMDLSEYAGLTGCSYTQGQKTHGLYPEPMRCDAGALPDAAEQFGCLDLVAPLPVWQGLDPAYPVVAMCQKEIWNLDNPANGFFSTGYETQYQVNYIIYRNEQFELIDSTNNLRAIFAPVESPEEALSFAVLVTGYAQDWEIDLSSANYEFLTDEIEETYVATTSDGYLVHLFDWHIRGCSPWYLSTVDVNVTYDGEVSKGAVRHFGIAGTDEETCLD
jgi:hypothetical protein